MRDTSFWEIASWKSFYKFETTVVLSTRSICDKKRIRCDSYHKLFVPILPSIHVKSLISFIAVSSSPPTLLSLSPVSVRFKNSPFLICVLPTFHLLLNAHLSSCFSYKHTLFSHIQLRLRYSHRPLPESQIPLQIPSSSVKIHLLIGWKISSDI